jgi:hypothetical protein
MTNLDHRVQTLTHLNIVILLFLSVVAFAFAVQVTTAERRVIVACEAPR